jgi:hypothetical protein
LTDAEKLMRRWFGRLTIWTGTLKTLDLILSLSKDEPQAERLRRRGKAAPSFSPG